MDFSSIISVATSGLGSVLTGGITGILGSAVSFFTNYKLKQLDIEVKKQDLEAQKLKYEHDERMVKLESDAAIAEVNARIKITEVMVAGDIARAEQEALGESYKSASSQIFDKSYLEILSRSKWTSWLVPIITFLFAISDFASHILRPAATIYLVVATTLLTNVLLEILVKTNKINDLGADEIYGLVVLIVNALVYLTISALSWWFCDRTVSKYMQQLGTDIRANKPKVPGK